MMEVLTVKEVSTHLKCSTSSVYELIRKEKIHPVVKIGKKILVPVLSLEAFILNKPLEYIINLKRNS